MKGKVVGDDGCEGDTDGRCGQSLSFFRDVFFTGTKQVDRSSVKTAAARPIHFFVYFLREPPTIDTSRCARVHPRRAVCVGSRRA